MYLFKTENQFRHYLKAQRLITVASVVLAIIAVFVLVRTYDEPKGENIPDHVIKISEDTTNIPTYIIEREVYEGQTSEPFICNIEDELVAFAETSESEKPKIYTEEDVEILSKLVYGEALITQSDLEWSVVVWCVLNRVDHPQKYPDSIVEVVTAPNQFYGYREDNLVLPEVRKLVVDVLDRWQSEKEGEEDVGRTLPNDYYYFEGDGWHNHFFRKWTESGDKDYWDWSLPNPYKS